MKIAINGFGRIGRLVFRIMEEEKDMEVVAINDLTSPKDLAYLLKYDTSHGNYKKDQITSAENSIIVDGRRVNIYSEKDPKNLPWKELGIDLVFECTGLFTNYEDAHKHIEAGAKKVLISAPAKGDIKTIVYNVNHKDLTKDDEIVSAASCTTNCLAPVLKIINDNFKIIKGEMTTVHAYTNDQASLDIAHKKGIESRRGRACAANIVPSSTGAAKAIGKVIPELNGKLDGFAMRVPVTTGSVIDLTLELNSLVDEEKINKAFEQNKNETIDITYDPIVSSDIIGTKYGSVVDGLLTKVLNVDEKQLVKIISWYDNEMSYSYQMVRTAKYLINLK